MSYRRKREIVCYFSPLFQSYAHSRCVCVCINQFLTADRWWRVAMGHIIILLHVLYIIIIIFIGVRARYGVGGSRRRHPAGGIFLNAAAHRQRVFFSLSPPISSKNFFFSLSLSLSTFQVWLLSVFFSSLVPREHTRSTSRQDVFFFCVF